MASSDSKSRKREFFLKARNALSVDEVKLKSQEIQERLLDLDEYQKAKTLFFYCSKGSEVDTIPLIQDAIQSGKRVALPLCRDEVRIEARWVTDLRSDCSEGRFGIWEPQEKKTIRASLDEINYFVIPGLAFDLKGHRLGWGRGYFDRFLEALKRTQIKIGLAYELQVCDALPADEYDVKVDILVTEGKVSRFNEGAVFRG